MLDKSVAASVPIKLHVVLTFAREGFQACVLGVSAIGRDQVQLDKMIRINKTRADYLAKFEELIESYNAGSRNIEESKPI